MLGTLLALDPEVSGADVAETSYTAFCGTDAIQGPRLVVRLLRPHQIANRRCSLPGTTTPFVTIRPGELVEIEADHRRHAVAG